LYDGYKIVAEIFPLHGASFDMSMS